MKIDALKQFDTREATYEFELKHPATGEGLGVFLTILSPDSEAPKKIVNRLLAKQQRAEAQKRPLDMAALEEDYIAICAAMLVGWRGLEDEDGKALPFSAENAREYVLSVTAFREQINEAGKDSANFIKP